MSDRYLKTYRKLRAAGTILKGSWCGETTKPLGEFLLQNPFGNVDNGRIIISYSPAGIDQNEREAVEFPRRVYEFIHRYER